MRAPAHYTLHLRDTTNLPRPFSTLWSRKNQRVGSVAALTSSSFSRTLCPAQSHASPSTKKLFIHETKRHSRACYLGSPIQFCTVKFIVCPLRSYNCNWAKRSSPHISYTCALCCFRCIPSNSILRTGDLSAWRFRCCVTYLHKSLRHLFTQLRRFL
jgi:hypothetical protein